MHPFQSLFHGDMHMGDSNLPKQFQPILMHGFREIDLWNLQSFFIFFEICASIDHDFAMGGASWWKEHAQQVSDQSGSPFGSNGENKFWSGENLATAAWRCRFERGNKCLQLRSGQRTPAKGKKTKNHQPRPHATKGSRHAAAKITSQQPFDFRYVTNTCSSITWI